MKKRLFTVFVILLIISSCNNDDEEIIPQMEVDIRLKNSSSYNFTDVIIIEEDVSYDYGPILINEISDYFKIKYNENLSGQLLTTFELSTGDLTTVIYDFDSPIVVFDFIENCEKHTIEILLVNEVSVICNQ